MANMNAFEKEMDGLRRKYVDRPITRRLLYEMRVDVVAVDLNESLNADQKHDLKAVLNQLINRSTNGTEV